MKSTKRVVRDIPQHWIGDGFPVRSLFSYNEGIRIEADSAVRALLLSGEPLGEPVVGQGPFVMNTREQIREAMVDYQAGRMGRLAPS